MILVFNQQGEPQVCSFRILIKLSIVKKTLLKYYRPTRSGSITKHIQIIQKQASCANSVCYYHAEIGVGYIAKDSNFFIEISSSK